MIDSAKIAASGVAAGLTMTAAGLVVVVAAIPFVVWLAWSDWRIARQPGIGGRKP
jgi:hypothetical protein